MAEPWAIAAGRLQLRRAIAAVRFDAPAPPKRAQAGKVLLGMQGHRKTTREMLIAGGVAGGFLAGGLLSAKLDNCRCDDPGLQGFIIGAPIGAVGGGIVMWALTRR